MIGLPRDEIHLWQLSMADAAAPELITDHEQILAEAERQRASRFVRAQDRRRYLLTRLLVRGVLSRYSQIPASDWSFTTNAHGKPAIGNAGESSRLAFNVSHSGDLIVLVIAARRDLGIDIEDVRIRVDYPTLAKKYFSPAEATALRSCPEQNLPEQFFSYWTLKEAYIKARGAGLLMPLHRFGFRFTEDRRIEASFAPELSDSAASWRFWMFRFAQDFVLSICARSTPEPPERIVMRRIVPWDKAEMLPEPIAWRSD